MNRTKVLLIVVIAALVACFFLFDLGRFLSLDYLKSSQAELAQWKSTKPLVAALTFFLIYVLATSLSVPGATILTLAGGAIFGFAQGLTLVSLASTVGATLAFLASRYFLRTPVQSKFGDKLSAINDGVEKDGAFYLFTLRLVPAFPFFVVNLVMGLTPIKTSVYALVSWIGMLPATAVFVNAGTQLARIDSAKGLLSPTLIGSFALIGLLPLIARKSVAFIRREK